MINDNTLLDELIGVSLPKGYLACISCHRYFHHPIVYCPNCGQKVDWQKNITWREFLKLFTASGPYNTFRSILLQRNSLTWKDNFPIKVKNLLREAWKLCGTTKKKVK